MAADSGMNRASQAPRSAGEQRSFRAIILASSLVLAFTQACALGLERSLTASSLGQPLNLVVPVQIDPNDQVTLECVKAEVQSGDAQIPAPLIHVSFDTGDGGALRALRVTTEPRIEEPVVTVKLSVGCPVRLTRRFVVFVDPPVQAYLARTESGPSHQPAPADVGRTYKQAVAAAPASGAEDTPDTLSSAEVAVHRKSKAHRASATHMPRTASKVARHRRAPDHHSDGSALANADKMGDAESAKAVSAASRRTVRATERAASTAEARLRLDATTLALTDAAMTIAPEVSAVASVAGIAPASAPASAAASDSPAASKASADAVRLQAPEVIQQTARAAAKRSEGRMPTLRTVWRSAQQGSPLALFSGLMVLLLCGAIVYIWRLPGQEMGKRRVDWPNSREPAGGSEQTDVQAGPRPPTVARVRSVVYPSSRAEKAAAATAPASAGKDATAVLMDALSTSRKPAPALHEQTQAFVSTGTWADFTSAGFPTETAAPEHGRAPNLNSSATRQEKPPPVLHSGFSDLPANASTSFDAGAPVTRETSVEELIYLEQQVEFCVALGQDDAAIELLVNHVQSTGGCSALPYLKLLEIYKRRGDQPAYAGLRDGFIQRFGVATPSWDEDLSSGAGLEAYTSVLERIQHSWHDFGSSMALLQRLLVAPQGRQAGLSAVASNLSLPACLDLLLLYSVARDLSAQEVQGDAVDVFLPLDQLGSSPLATSMMATLPRPLTARSSTWGDLDLDLSVGDSTPARL